MKQNPLKKNTEIELTIEGITSEGHGVGRVDGVAVFVPMTAVGERVRALIIKVEKQYCIGKCVELLSRSAERIVPPCEAYSLCGGCTMQHLSYKEQLRQKTQFVKDAFTRIGGFDAPEVLDTLGMVNPWRYRNKGSFPYRSVANTVCFGFYAPRSHRLIPLFDCPIQDERVVRVAKTIAEWANRCRISVYEEETKRGILRSCMARVTQNGAIMAVVVTTGKLPHEAELVESLDFVDSIYHNINDRDTNVIFGTQFRLLFGPAQLFEEQDGIRFAVSPQSFLQVNPIQTSVLYDTAVRLLSPTKEETILDLYCGIGTISLKLASVAGKVIGIESVPEAISDAKHNAALNHADNTDFYCGKCEDIVPKLVQTETKLDAIMLDPPRKGCEPEVLKAIADSGVKRIVYVSCNPATLARDSAHLSSYGFAPTVIQPVDMFPHTHHVECVVLMTKVQK